MSKLKVKAFTSTCVVDEAGRAANLQSVLKRGLPVCSQQPKRTGSLALVGSGPSVRDYLDEIKSCTEIWAVNGANGYLLAQGIVPHGFIGMDPLPGLAEYAGTVHLDTTCYIASTCDPSVFDVLSGHKVMLWHAEAENMIYPKGEWVVGGGTTALTRVPYLGAMLGWRDIKMYGADSSYDDGPYCYEWGTYALDIDQPTVPVSINGEGPFITELGLMKQVPQLWVLHQKFNGMLQFRCKGLLAAYMRAPVTDDSNLELTDDKSDAA